MGNISMKMLAKELNLSVSTISKVFTNSHEISEQTRRRVLELAGRLNYVPNPYASSLRKRTSNTIAVVIPEVADSFFSMAINGIEVVAREKGYHVLIYLTHEEFIREQQILSGFQSGRVDGVLISVTHTTTSGEHIRNMMQRGIPVVFFDRVLDLDQRSEVRTNDKESGYAAAEHLILQGCRRIVYLTVSENLSISSQRLEGCRQALAKYGLPFDRSQQLVCSDDEGESLHMLSDRLKREPRPDGAVVSVEKLVTPLYLACKQLRIRIPQEIRIIGFSNQASSRILNPSLSTITQPAFEMGKTAASILFRRLEKKPGAQEPFSSVIPSRLIARASTTGQDEPG